MKIQILNSHKLFLYNSSNPITFGQDLLYDPIPLLQFDKFIILAKTKIKYLKNKTDRFSQISDLIFTCLHDFCIHEMHKTPYGAYKYSNLNDIILLNTLKIQKYQKLFENEIQTYKQQCKNSQNSLEDRKKYEIFLYTLVICYKIFIKLSFLQENPYILSSTFYEKTTSVLSTHIKETNLDIEQQMLLNVVLYATIKLKGE